MTRRTSSRAGRRCVQPEPSSGRRMRNGHPPKHWSVGRLVPQASRTVIWSHGRPPTAGAGTQTPGGMWDRIAWTPQSMPVPRLPCHASEPRQAGRQGTAPGRRVRSPDTRGGRCARAAGGGRETTQTVRNEIAGLEVGAADRRIGGRGTRRVSRGQNRRRSPSGSPRRRGQRRSDRQGHLRIVGAHGHSPRHARGGP